MKWINKLLLSIVWVGLVASCSDDDSHELPVISPVLDRDIHGHKR